MYIEMSLCAVHLKLTRYCKSTIQKLKKNLGKLIKKNKQTKKKPPLSLHKILLRECFENALVRCLQGSWWPAEGSKAPQAAAQKLSPGCRNGKARELPACGSELGLRCSRWKQSADTSVSTLVWSWSG